MTKKLIPAILLLLLLLPKAQSQQEYPVIPFATQGTDFWVAFPWNFEGMTWGSKVYLAVVAERDCDLTIANERLDFHRSYHIMRRFMAGPDTNIIELDFEWVHNVDTLVAGLSPSQQPANQPNNMCFHITTTDKMDGVKDPYRINTSGILKNTDCYSTLQLAMTYSFGPKCKTCMNSDW